MGERLKPKHVQRRGACAGVDFGFNGGNTQLGKRQPFAPADYFLLCHL
jgi:hypothetical protein